MSQAAALEALLHGEDDVRAMVASYDERRKLMVARPQRHRADLLRADAARSTPSPPSPRTGLTSDEFAEKLLVEEQVAVVPGSAFGEAGEGFVRCTYCTAQDKIEEAIERMGRFVRAHSQLVPR